MNIRTLFLPLMLTSTLVIHAQAPRIVLQGSGDPQVFAEFNDALAAAQPNDKLYFSGGSFAYPANTTISMPLHFIGAGIHPDSTVVTDITTLQGVGTGSLIITNGASNSTFTGIRFNPSNSVNSIQYGTNSTDDHPTGILFERCHFNGDVELGAETNDGTYSSTTFVECIFKREVNGRNGSAVMTRCILDFDPGVATTVTLFQNPGTLLFDHSVLLNGRIVNSDGATIRNSIFTRPNGGAIHQSNNATISNCIFVYSEATSNSNNVNLTNNLFNVTPAQLFVNETDGVYQYADDLNLVTGSPGIGGANDGTDIGLYGSNSPYKEGAIPYNPHYRAADIAPATDGDGNLPVQIKVAAQTN